MSTKPVLLKTTAFEKTNKPIAKTIQNSSDVVKTIRGFHRFWMEKTINNALLKMNPTTIPIKKKLSIPTI